MRMILVCLHLLVGVYNHLSCMDPQEPEWEGFETFNDDSRLPLTRPSPSPGGQSPEKQPDRAEKMTALHKKLTFRSKNKRKASFVSPMPSQPARKTSIQLQLTTTLAQRTFQADRAKRTTLTFQKRDNGIPIFHEGEFRPPQGQLLYRRVPLPTAQEELARNGRAGSPWEGGEEVRFESRFQSGNLQQVVRVGSEYHLYMAVDTNTRGHRQWFYFTVTAPAKQTLTLIVHSFRKKMSLFQIGMRPYGKRREESEEAWRAVGRNVKYLRSDRIVRNQRTVDYTLSFEIELQREEEFCIASCVPYTYSFLKESLQMLTTPVAQRVEIRQETLCRTLTGLEVPIITINGPAINRPHRYLIINARTHPGESSSSWVTDGILREVSASGVLQGLILEFGVVVKIVPMLNVEGVCLGNYRTGTMGMDFNRLFLQGSPDLFPEVAALKRLVQECKARGKVDLFLDLHGHSILPGCFMYGPDPLFAPKTALGRLVREMGKSRYFMRSHCVQGVDSSKIGTSRIYFQVQEGVFSLTCENSLGLYCKNGQKGKEVQFEARDWQEFGKELISIILNIYDQYSYEERESSPDKNNDRNAFEEALNLIRSAEEQEFVWEKSKTDNGKMQDQLALLNGLELDQIDLPRQLTLTQTHEPYEEGSLNDSDASSEDLPLHRQQELVKMVRKTLISGQVPGQSSSSSLINPVPTTAARQEQRASLSLSKGKFINNFKEIRFGVEDSTITDWYTRKRLLSVPKHLKNERHGQSYLIRKKCPLPNGNGELAMESAEMSKRVRTEQRERPSLDRHSNKELAARQKLLLENLLMRRS